MERALIDYFANSLWQVPMLAGAAWFLIKMSKPQVRLEHAVWLGALLLAVVLPARGIRQDEGAAGPTVPAAVASGDAGNVRFSGSVATLPASALRTVVATAKTSGVGVASPAVSGKPVSALPLPASSFFLGSRSLDSRSSKAKFFKSNWSPGLPWWVRVHRVQVTPLVLRGLCWIYLGAVAFGVLRLARAWSGARHVVRHSTVASLSSRDSELLEQCCRNFDLRSPEILTSDQVSSPVVVGVFRPRVVLPIDFAEYSDDEARAVLCHELAHINRRDYLVNLLCQVAALPVSYHPATTAIQQRIRQTREMICDDLASAGMRPGYARCLIGLAQRIVAGRGIAEQVQAVGLFDNNKLEERVMRLMESVEGSGSERTRSGGARTFRVVSGIAAMVAVIVAVAMVHVTPAIAGPANLQSSGPVLPAGARRTVQSGSQLPAAQPAPADIKTEAPGPAPRPASAVGSNPRLSAARAAEPALADGLPIAVPGPADELPAAAGAAKTDEQLDPTAQPGPTPQAGAAPRQQRKVFDLDHVIVLNGVRRKMTPAEWERFDKELNLLDGQKAALKKQLDELLVLDSPEFKKQMEAVKRQVADSAGRIDSPEFKALMEKSSKMMDNPEFKKQMEEAAKSWDQADLRKRLEDMRGLDSPEFKKQMEDVKRQVADSMAHMNGPELKGLMEKDWKMMDSPEFKKRMEDAERRASEAAAQIDSPAFRQRMAEFEKKMHDGELQRSMEAASKAMRDAAEGLKSLQNK